MSRFGLSCAGLLALWAARAEAANWPPIPAQVWSMKEDAASGDKGAVVLEDRLSFRVNHIEFLYRVRILSEAGRDAAELATFPSDAYDVDGRTIFPDGHEIRFSDKKDLQTLALKGHGESQTRSKIAAPGVTSDCVVEIRWKESANENVGPLPAHYGYFHQFALGNRYRTLTSTVELPLQFPWTYVFTGPKDMKPEVKDRVIYTFRNIPAVEDLPFMLEPIRDLPRVTVFWQPDILAPLALEGEAPYWKGVARLVYKDWYKASKGSDVDAFTRELLRGLPEDPLAKAIELMQRLDGRIANVGSLTFEEKSKKTEGDDKEIDSSDLGAAVRHRRTDGFGMFLLYLHLLKQAGMKPTVALVADRDRIFFRHDMLSPFQLNRQLVGITAPGRGTIWVDPSLRFASPGLVLPDYQGTRGLELDVDTWTMKPVTIPAQTEAFNVRKFSYDITAGEEEDLFKVVASFGGYPEYAQRRRFMALEPKEQARTLKEDLEADLQGASITRTEVLHAQDPKDNVTWEAEGRLEVESGRRRIVKPFPAMPRAVPIPSALPEKRSEPIIMPYSRTQVAKSRVRMPAGYRLSAAEPTKHENLVGTVAFSAREVEPGVAEAVMRVELRAVVLRPEAYPQVKDYLAWVEDAARRTLVLERSR
jgi:hypothetical protein